jgi:SPP1 family predicted phage head-tail adaptor
VRAGTYRTPVTLEQPVQTVAANGSASLVYLDVGGDFAAIRALRQSERVSAGRLEGAVSHEIRLRHREDLSGGWRLRAGTRTFWLQSVTDSDDRGRELVCLAEEEGT